MAITNPAERNAWTKGMPSSQLFRNSNGKGLRVIPGALISVQVGAAAPSGDSGYCQS